MISGWFWEGFGKVWEGFGKLLARLERMREDFYRASWSPLDCLLEAASEASPFCPRSGGSPV